MSLRTGTRPEKDVTGTTAMSSGDWSPVADPWIVVTVPGAKIGAVPVVWMTSMISPV